MTETPPIYIKTCEGIHNIPQKEWDALNSDNHPFTSHAFLSALEEARTVCDETGWRSMHLVAKAGNETVAVAPLYLKSHSFGEYVFDQGWADAYERAGGHYYPKLISAVPFSPVPGPRLLSTAVQGQTALLKGIETLTAELGLATAHITFLQKEEAYQAAQNNFLTRTGLQYHFENAGYRDFNDFLDSLASRKRKALRKERLKAQSGLTFSIIEGKDIKERHLDQMFAFYMDTSSRKWGQAYLNRAFFSILVEKMPENIVLFFAEKEGAVIAGAMNIRSQDALYGRYWGCSQFIPFLHFELCYYQAINYAIHHGLKRVEAGAQGEHKLLRGYSPVTTYSSHLIRDPGFRDAIAGFLRREGRLVDMEKEALTTLTPFRKRQ